MSEYDDLLDEVMSDELAEGVKGGGQETGGAPRVRQDESSQGSKLPSPSVSPSASVIRTPEEVPAAVERVVGPTIQDRAYIDQEWLLRRAGKKK